MLKRSFDLLASAFGLAVLSPLFLAIAIWIKFDSPGPVFFRQERVGRNGKTFLIHKFRTMFIHRESALQITVGDDARITGAGRYLRKYKIDELPQLIDVFRGKMSLVGPRPEVPAYMRWYPTEIREKILSVRPGITDLASIEMIDESRILGMYSNPEKAYVDEILPLKQKYYISYVNKQSFFNDLKIIMLTLKKVFFR